MWFSKWKVSTASWERCCSNRLDRRNYRLVRAENYHGSKGRWLSSLSSLSSLSARLIQFCVASLFGRHYRHQKPSPRHLSAYLNTKPRRLYQGTFHDAHTAQNTGNYVDNRCSFRNICSISNILVVYLEWLHYVKIEYVIVLSWKLVIKYYYRKIIIIKHNDSFLLVNCIWICSYFS